MKLKIIKNKKIIISILLLTIGVIAINYTFFKPTKINLYIASKLYKTPANTAFTDDNFYKCVVDAYNEQNNATMPYTANLTDGQLQEITNINCSSKEIVSTDGLEKILTLTVLSIGNNQLTNLDVSNNLKLKSLSASHNQLTNLDVSNNLELESLSASYNHLTGLDISNNSELNWLDVSNNQLTTLDVTNNPVLNWLDVSNNLSYNNLVVKNQLTELDISNNIELKQLYVSNNQLTDLDVSKNIKLINLQVSNNQLTDLDVSNNIELVYLFILNNQLTDLDVSNNMELVDLSVSNNQLTDLDVSNNIELGDLSVSNNQLTDLDVSNNIELVNLSVSNNKLTDLDVSNNIELGVLSVSGNQLTDLDVRNNLELVRLYVYNNQLTSLDVSNNIELGSLDVSNNQLTSLDVSNNIELGSLDVYNNQLTTIDLSKNINLEIITINNNPYSENLNCYKGNNIQLGNNVKFPSHIAITNNWKSQDNSIATVDNNGVATTLKTGTVTITNDSNKYKTTSMLNIIEITSDKYVINNDKNYIYIGTDLINENIIGNFNIPKDINLTITPDNKLQVKYNGDILKEFTLINVLSGVYNLTNDYIYVGTGQLDLTKINITNGSIVQEENQLKLKHEDTILKTWDIISISQEKYLLGNNYIYVGTNDLDLEKINIINATLVNEDEKLKVKYREQIIYEYNILSIDFKELSVKGNSIVITEDIPYEDFTNNITPNGVTYKIFNKEAEVTEGTITKDMVLKIYKDDEEIYEYQITDEFLDLSLLTIDEEESLIKNLKLGTAISSFKENILTSGSVKILDQDGEELKDTDLVRSGAKVVIELSKDTYEYTLSVKGDVTGTGKSTVSDVGKLYQYLRKKIPMDKCYIEAGNVIDTDNEIKITDVGKLYQFIKGKIDSLEG